MRKRVLIALAILLALCGIAVAKRHDAVRFTLVHALGLATGYEVRLAGDRVGTSHAALLGLALSKHGQVVFRARRVDVWYSLRDLLPGSRRRFGLVGLAVDHPMLSVIKYADHTWDVPLHGRRSLVPSLPPARNGVPLRYFIRVTNATLSMESEGNGGPLVARNVDVSARVDTAARTHYLATGAFAAAPQAPFVLRGTIDMTRGFAMHRFTAPVLPLSTLANMLIDSQSVVVLAGTAHGFDARLFALGDPGTALAYHYSLGFDLAGGSLTLPGLIHPVDAIGGRLALVDDAFLISGLHAKIVGIPLRAQGAIFNFARPQIRIGVTGEGDMALLRRAFRFSVDQPLSGPLRLGILVEGGLDDPSVVANAASPRMFYRGFPFDALAATVVFHHDVVAFTPLRLRYGGVTATGRGSLVVGDRLRERMDLHFVAPANRLPYVGALLGAQPLLGDAALDGADLRVRVVGALAARSGVDNAAALFDFGEDGVADVAPFWMRAGAGELDAGFHLDRPTGTSAFWLAGDGIAMRDGAVASALPNLSLPQMPPVVGTVRHIGIVGGERNGAIALAGSVSTGHTSIGGVPFDTLAARFDGSLAGASIDSFAATGPWGRFVGAGTFSGTSMLTRGAFDGNLDALRPLIGDIPAQGRVRGTLAVGIEPSGILVQAHGLRMQGASIDGVPLARADGTLLLGSGSVRVYAAHLEAAGGDIVAAGQYRFGTRHRSNASLAFVAGGVDAGALHALGVPLERGRLSLTGAMTGGATLPSFHGAASVSQTSVAGYALSGSAGISFDGSRVTFEHVVAGMNGTYGFADGSIDDVATGSPGFDIHAVTPAADIASVLRSMHLPGHEIAGTLDANVMIQGSSDAPSVAGHIGVPAGSINGLPFLDGDADIAARGGSVVARDGSLLVGTTHATFDAGLRPRGADLELRSANATFSDFNNYFDTGDTLAGAGSIAVRLATNGSHVETSGDIDVKGFRYRSLPIGDTEAAWSSHRNLVTGRLAVGGAEGLLRAHGSIALSPGVDWQATLKRSRYNMSASVDDLDLGLWISVLGFPQVPLTGSAFGSARMIGTYPELHLEGSTQIRNGTFGRFPINLFDLRFGSRGRRIDVESAQLSGPGLTASASGTIGLHATDPIDLRVTAATEDLPAFLGEVTRAHVPVSGAFAGTLRVGGDFAVPIFDAAFDAHDVRVQGVPISTLFGSVRLQGDRLELYDAGATFVQGSARISGDVPLHLAPFSLPRNTPVQFTVDANNVDASVFDALFGHDTELGGTLATHVALSGTVENPHMSGTVSVAKGSYSSTLDEAPITAANGTLTFSGSQIAVQSLKANAGSGTVALSGRADLAGSTGASFDGTMLLHGAQFASPVFGRATLDGDATIARTTGPALLSGNVTLTNTTIPFAAFVGGGAGGGGTAPSWPLAFAMKLKAGQNVRVRGSGYGAGMDISGTGSATLGGTLAAPSLSGGFDSTGGSLTYFDRSFRVLEGAVTFTPADGVIPTLHAVATATVVNPDPDVSRNPFGSATITINVDGPVDDLKIAFTSDPSGYTRDQIIAMLAPFGGFISGIQFNPYEVQIPGGAAAAVNNAPVPGGVFVQRNGTITVSQEAFSILNAQFASSLLAPVENVLGQTLGVSDVNLTLGYFGNVGVSVRRVLGKDVSAVYSSTFGLPNRQSFGIRFAPDALNEAALSFFYETGQLRLFETPDEIFGPVLLGQPLEGQSGFGFTFQHFFR